MYQRILKLSDAQVQPNRETRKEWLWSGQGSSESDGQGGHKMRFAFLTPCVLCPSILCQGKKMKNIYQINWSKICHHTKKASY